MWKTAKTPLPLSQQPIAKTPPPLSQQPTAKTPPPLSQQPIAKTPPPLSQQPIAKTPPPLSQQPTAKTPPPLSQQPTAKTPPPLSQQPTAKTPPPLSQQPTAKTPSPLSQQPIAKTPLPLSQQPTAKTPPSLSQQPTAKTPLPLSQQPTAKTPSPLSQQPIAKTPLPLSQQPTAKTPPSLSQQPTAKTLPSLSQQLTADSTVTISTTLMINLHLNSHIMASETKKTDSGNTVNVHEMVTNGLHAMVLAVGYKVGILDSFLKINKSCTAEDISKDAKLKLRYVQEWLGCMIASGVVKMDSENRYFLQNPESVYSAAQGACVLPVLAEMFPRLQNVMPMEGPSGYTFPESFAQWLDMVNSPYVNADWIENNIKDITDLIEDQNLQILDFGCGYGKFALEFSKMFSNATVWGIDIDKTAIEKSEVLRQKHKRDNLSFLLADGENLPDQWTSKFDLIVMLEVLHDLPDPVPVMKEIRRVLHPKGYAIAIDPTVHSEHKDNIGLVAAKSVLPYSMFVCLPMSMSKEPAVGHGIGWGYEKRKSFIEENGFSVVKIGNEDINTLNNRIVFRKNSV